jgi:hypothetical protein
MRFRRRMQPLAVVLALAGMLASPLVANASDLPALVYHATLAGGAVVADVDGVTINVNVQSESYRYTGGNTRPDFDAIVVAVSLTSDADGTVIEELEGFVPVSGSVAPDMSSATIPSTTVQIQDVFGGSDQASVTVSAEITATGPANRTQFIERFCGPPEPCFGMFNIVGSERPAAAVLTVSGVVDGIDIGQVPFTSTGGEISSLLGADLLG